LNHAKKEKFEMGDYFRSITCVNNILESITRCALDYGSHRADLFFIYKEAQRKPIKKKGGDF
jgi:hypothetical protein